MLLENIQKRNWFGDNNGGNVVVMGKREEPKENQDKQSVSKRTCQGNNFVTVIKVEKGEISEILNDDTPAALNSTLPETSLAKQSKHKSVSKRTWNGKNFGISKFY